MKLNDFYSILENFSPKSLSDEYCMKYDAYDNSGILIDCGQTVKKVLFSLDFSLTALETAKKEEANVLVTHHPAIYAKAQNIRCSDPQGKKLQFAVQNKISVISMHLNFDCAQGGIDEELMHGIGGKQGSIQESLSKSGCGYGRIYSVEPITAGDLCERIKQNFSTKRVWCYKKEKTIKKVASFCGAGATEKNVLQAVQGGADCIVSADFKHHVITMALEYGLSVIQLTHYASEDYGFKKIYKKIKEQLRLDCDYFSDEELL